MQEQGRRDVLPPWRAQPTPETQALLDEALARLPAPTAESLPACAPQESAELQRAAAAAWEEHLARVPDASGPIRHASTSRMRIRMAVDLHEMVGRTLRMAHVALGGKATSSQCIELLLHHFLSAWARVAAKAAREHPIMERDGWKCAVPICSNRVSLQGHHLVFQSQGGGNEPGNQSAICACHHLQGIHAGRLRARGQAPGGIVWEVGIRPDGVPSRIYWNDTLVAEAS